MRALCSLALILPALALAPGSTPAQALTDSLTVSYEVNGLRILHRRTTATNIFAANLYLLGGARQITAATAGIEPFLLMASEYGTRSFPGEETRRALARTGNSVIVSDQYDWSVFGLHGVKQEFDSSWAVFADRLMHPTLDSAAMAIVRARMVADAMSLRTSPDAQVQVLAESLAFQGHPYANDPAGSEASLKTLTAEDLRKYAAEQLVTSRMLLVVVGDISREQLDQAVGKTLATLPRGNYVWTLPEPLKTVKPAVAFAQRTIPTNYIFGYFAGPQASSPDYPAFEYAVMVIGSVFNSIVREEAALSYAASVPLMKRGATGAAFYVSTTRPDTVIKVANFLLNFYERDATIPRPILRKNAQGLRTSYLYSQGSAAAHADMLARAQLFDGDYRAAARRAEIMGKVGYPDIRRVLKTYTRNIQYAFVGDSAWLPRVEMLKR